MELKFSATVVEERIFGNFHFSSQINHDVLYAYFKRDGVTTVSHSSNLFDSVHLSLLSYVLFALLIFDQ